MNSKMNTNIRQSKQSGGYRIPSPSKTARRSSQTRKPSDTVAAAGGAHPELHRIMSLFQ